jgi:DNA replication and repair protein RecF
MYLSTLKLNNFRSYSSVDFKFIPTCNLIVGPNGAGKSNILEAIYFLATTKSYRLGTMSQLIKWQQNYAFLQTEVSKGGDQFALEIQLLTAGSVFPKRRLLFNQILKTRSQYLGHLFTVIFHPEDMRLLTGSPSRRRDFFDLFLGQLDWQYTSSLSQYHKSLRQRNHLLEGIKKGINQRNELFFWNQSLIKNAQIIHDSRLKFIRFVNNYFSSHPQEFIRHLAIIYKPSTIDPLKLDSLYSRELVYGHTLVGPHLDDFSLNYSLFKSDNPNLSYWGSRGQQRLAILALKLAQISYLEELTDEKPILLLDDILSELDYDHQRLVIDLTNRYQSIITSSDENITTLFPKANLIRIKSE